MVVWKECLVSHVHMARSWGARHKRLVCGVTVVLSSVLLMGPFLTNVGYHLRLRDMLSDRQTNAWALWAERAFDAALWWRPHGRAARIGKAYNLAERGEMRPALDLLIPVLYEDPGDPFVYQETLRGLMATGEVERAIALYETRPPLRLNDQLRAWVALAYLKRGGEEAWRKALSLRPHDLNANYHLWRLATERGDTSAATNHLSALQQFPLGALYPAGLMALVPSQISIFPGLYGDRIWDRARTARSVANALWICPHCETWPETLTALSEQHPGEADWSYYLGELYERRGLWEQAAASYARALQIDPQFHAARLRWGIVLQAPDAGGGASEERLRAAYAQLKAYHATSPDDLLGLRQLAQVADKVAPAEAPAWERALAARSDPRELAGRLLKVMPESVALGPNLVANADFAQWSGPSQPQNWETFVAANRAPYGSGAFVLGCETLDGNAARVDGLWATPPPTGGIEAHAGWTALVPEAKSETRWSFPVRAGEKLLVTVEYASRKARAQALVGHDPQASLPGIVPLAETGGQVQIMPLLFAPQTDSVAYLVLRQLGEGSVAFRAVVTRKVLVP